MLLRVAIEKTMEERLSNEEREEIEESEAAREGKKEG